VPGALDPARIALIGDMDENNFSGQKDRQDAPVLPPAMV
jgi:hypothetical protein